jgi:apolipoprotein N-acyltransferase
VGLLSLRPSPRRALVLVATAFAMGLAFPRTSWEGSVWVALAPLIVDSLRQPLRQAFAWGWVFGTVFYLVLLRWLDFTFRTYSTIPWPLTWGPTFALAGYCALYVGAFAAAIAWLARRSTVWALCASPFLWVAGEWIRGHLFGGFPWGLLGYSQYLRLPVIQIAELAGVYAVSLVIVAINAAIAGCFVLAWRPALSGVALAGALIGGTLAFGFWRLAAPAPPGEVTVAIMQPSIEQPLKFDPAFGPTTLAIYLTLTSRAGADRAGAERPDLIVWPETATPTPLRRDPELLRTLGALSGSLHVPLLVGSIDIDASTPPKVRNTAFLITERGIVGRYDKIQLVPFGEYVPLSGLIGFVRSWAEFIAELEPGSSASVFAGPPAPFGVVICYEGIFPELVREFVKGGARLIVNMTNDAWFGRTSGPWQHLAMYPFRAVEHRVAVVRAANTGVSAFIMPTGKIVRRVPLYERATAAERVPLRARDTLYSRFGDWLAYLALAVSGALLAHRAWKRVA